MTVEIHVALDTGSEGIAKLEKLVQRAEDKAGLLKNIGEALLETTDQRFEDQKDPQGVAWAPLKPLTVELRGASGPILIRSGQMRGNTIHYEVSGDTLRLGSSAIQAAAQNFGATIEAKDKPLRMPMKGGGAKYARKVTLPPRPFIGFGHEDERATTETVQDWFDLDG